MQASDELNQVSEKYQTIIVKGKPTENKASNLSLLDLDGIDLQQCNADPMAVSEDAEVDVLCDVFSSANIPEQPSIANDVLLPLVASKPEEPTVLNCQNKTEPQIIGKFKALEELDVLSEHLLKENLQAAKTVDQQFNK